MKETMMMNMKQAISNVLEIMFFLPVQFFDNNCPLIEWLPQNQTYVGAILGFSGPVSGSYYFIIPSNVAKEITANFLGLGEEEVSEAQKIDTVKEALNMIGGHMLSLVEASENFQLGIPEIIPQTDMHQNGFLGQKEHVIFIENDEKHLAAGFMLD